MLPISSQFFNTTFGNPTLGLGSTGEAGSLSREEVDDWASRNRQIDENWRWFDGEALKEEDQDEEAKDGEYPLKYPLQINPAQNGARIHAYALVGMTPDTAGPLVRTKCDPRDPESDASTKEAEYADKVLLDIDYENDSRATFMDMAMSIQALGGIVMRVAWDPTNVFRPSGIRYDYLDPRYCYFRWNGTDYWNITEAWVRMDVSAYEAERYYGVKIPGPYGIYLEYWDKDQYWVKINDQPATRDGKPLSGQHGFGFVPFIYVPHERVNGFWGKSIVDGVIGMIQEINSREADIGDAVHFAVNDILFGVNIRNGYPVFATLPNGQKWLNGGRATSSTDPEADMKRLEPAKLPEGVNEYTNRLWENVRLAMLTPDIAYGKEEGSQRSGATLYSRMWPLLAHVESERTNWTAAFNRRAEMALQILSQKKVNRISQSHTGLRKRQLWAPMVPVDRQQLVEEIINRFREGAASLEFVLEKFGDVPDVAQELKRIEDAQAKEQQQNMAVKQMELDAKAKQAAQAGNSGGLQTKASGNEARGNSNDKAKV